MTQQAHTGGKETELGVILFVVAVLLFFPIMSKAARPYYNQVVIECSKALLMPVSIVSQEAAALRGVLNKVTPKTMEEKRVAMVWGYTCSWYRWFFTPLLVYLAVKAWQKNLGEKFKRKLSMWTLLLNNVRDFPCLSPIIKSGPINEKAHHEGDWAVARSPIQFVAENGLLLDINGQPYGKSQLIDENCLALKNSIALENMEGNSLDRKKLKSLLAQQLGMKFNGQLSLLPDHQRGLALALLAHGHDDKVTAFKTFNQLALSWDPTTKTLSADGVDELIGKYSVDVAELRIHQTYVNVWFASLLTWSRKKGALPNSLWIWLRPTDRTLFYTMNQMGGRVAWVEGIGPWSHFIAEKTANQAIEEAQIIDGVESVKAALCGETWLAPGTVEQEDTPPAPLATVAPGEEPEVDAINTDLMEAADFDDEDEMELAAEELFTMFMPPDPSVFEDAEEADVEERSTL